MVGVIIDLVLVKIIISIIIINLTIYIVQYAQHNWKQRQFCNVQTLYDRPHTKKLFQFGLENAEGLGRFVQSGSVPDSQSSDSERSFTKFFDIGMTSVLCAMDWRTKRVWMDDDCMHDLAM